jgi:hypothetical protein
MKIGIYKLIIMVSQILLPAIIFLSSFSCQQNTQPEAISNDPAVVQEVKVSGSENSYTFAVTLKSPDTGCEQYANWWEVLSADGTSLIYRRILGHSHVDEQPFTRSGGVVAITADREVIVRAHMHSAGYGEGPIAMKGSVADGFKAYDVALEFGSSLEKADPQPTGCAF